VFVCCECFVLSGRGLCDGLITRPEESYRRWCVIVCDLKPQEWGCHGPRWAAAPQGEKNIIHNFCTPNHLSLLHMIHL